MCCGQDRYDEVERIQDRVTRRKVLKALGAVGGLVAVGGLAGCMQPLSNGIDVRKNGSVKAQDDKHQSYFNALGKIDLDKLKTAKGKLLRALKTLRSEGPSSANTKSFWKEAHTSFKGVVDHLEKIGLLSSMDSMVPDILGSDFRRPQIPDDLRKQLHHEFSQGADLTEQEVTSFLNKVWDHEWTSEEKAYGLNAAANIGMKGVLNNIAAALNPENLTTQSSFSTSDLSGQGVVDLASCLAVVAAGAIGGALVLGFCGAVFFFEPEILLIDPFGFVSCSSVAITMFLGVGYAIIYTC
ncbi:twin-arginine translocation signal domain-containing protein [Candidatus Acetothermia bacterium]|nr:twin-arginine translocation signal domain-containing protein [Candidatus Acetothermia bacterium]MBI3643947.1 twin-arginine translocation signal domain-containing protein [Candidatus Acetothermia bacterium]